MADEDDEPPEKLYGCQAVIRHLRIPDPGHCAGCHCEMDAVDEGVINTSISWFSGRLADGVEYEDVCCSTAQAINLKETGVDEGIAHIDG